MAPRNQLLQFDFSIGGVNRTIRNLNRINQVAATPAVASGIKAGLRVIRKAIRKRIKKGVEGTNLYSVRKTIDFRFVKSKKRKPPEIWAKVGASVGKRIMQAHRGQTHGKHISKFYNAHWYFVGTPNRVPTQMWTRNPKPYPVREGYIASRSMALSTTRRVMVKSFAKNMKKRIKRVGIRQVAREVGKYKV